MRYYYFIVDDCRMKLVPSTCVQPLKCPAVTVFYIFDVTRNDNAIVRKGNDKISNAATWRRKRYGRYSGRHTNLKFGMAAPYQLAEIWAVDFREHH